VGKITLVWIDNPDRPFKRFSVPKTLIYTLIGGFFLFLATTVLFLFLARNYYATAKYLNEENSRLSMLLSGNETENRQLRAELEKIQSVETKIRRFLGLNENVEDKDRAHQGGTAGLSELSLSDGMICHENEDALPLETLPTTNPLLDNLREVLGFLEDRREESRKIPMILPAGNEDAWLAGSFGWRTDPFTGTGREFHNGLDIAGPWKTPIIAPADAKVVVVGKNRFLGNYVRLRHSEEYVTVYGHLASAAVKRGQQVRRGDVIGLMGNTGRSTGTHLHYSILRNKRFVNPINYVWDRFNSSLVLKNADASENL